VGVAVRAARPSGVPARPLRQTIESINQTFKGQLDLERHGGHTPNGVLVRVLQRILALIAAIWHNDKTDAPVHRSLTATTTDSLEQDVQRGPSSGMSRTIGISRSVFCAYSS
jgi:hypothetical protein